MRDPKLEMVKLNIDGASRGNQRAAGAGALHTIEVEYI